MLSVSFIVLTSILFCLVWLFLGLIAYFTPAIIAYIRNHKNITQIAILNLFVGWTFLGWIAALLWSLNSDINPD